eukprot:1206949-Pyramimonas_sp.AAC.1
MGMTLASNALKFWAPGRPPTARESIEANFPNTAVLHTSDTSTFALLTVAIRPLKTRSFALTIIFRLVFFAALSSCTWEARLAIRRALAPGESWSSASNSLALPLLVTELHAVQGLHDAEGGNALPRDAVKVVAW